MYGHIPAILQSTNILYFIVFCICLIGLYLYYRSDKPSLPKLYYADTEFNRFVIDRVTRFRSKYSPPLFFKNRHVHCIVGGLVYRKVSFIREYINLSDGGVVALDWTKTTDEVLHYAAPILLVLAGLTGSKMTVQYMCQLASSKQYRVVVVNKRGHDYSKLTTPILQIACNTGDLRQCVEFIYRKYPKTKMAAVGYSAGCGLLSRYLSDHAGNTLISASVFIGSGYNLSHLCLHTISRFYERILVYLLYRSVIKPHSHILKSVVDLKAVARCSTFRQFEYYVYCNMHGYRDVAEMWTDNNPMKNIHKIDVPLLCINSLDDPICPFSNIPYDLFQRPGWMLVTTERGGHTKFIENWALESWADKCAIDYIETVLEYQKTSSNGPDHTSPDVIKSLDRHVVEIQHTVHGDI